MATKHVSLTDREYEKIGRRHGSEKVSLEAGETRDRVARDAEVLGRWGIGRGTLGSLEGLRAEHATLLAERPEAVAQKNTALEGRDAAVNAGWTYVHQVEGALSAQALGDSELAAALNAALPSETSGLEAGILALAKILDAHKDRADAEFDAAARVGEAEGLAAAVRSELAAAPVAKAAPVADTREIDVLDGKIATLLARINKTARRAFRSLGDDSRAREYRFHHLYRSGTRRGSGPAPAPAA